ncbi:MAG: DUF2671 domain-containing protein [Wolbachia sp.]|nr:DUF2671 domain-containing protein [Wolbachia sp.]
MSYNIASEADTLSEKSSKDEGASLLQSPAYREQYKVNFDCAQKKGMDIVQCNDGTIIFIENKPAMYYYGWDSKKREFVRKKPSTPAKNDNAD